jgi:hypothetical protein
MTEAEWLLCEGYAEGLLGELARDGRPTERKLLLYGTACYRRLAPFRLPPLVAVFLDWIERRADRPSGEWPNLPCETRALEYMTHGLPAGSAARLACHAVDQLFLAAGGAVPITAGEIDAAARCAADVVWVYGYGPRDSFVAAYGDLPPLVRAEVDAQRDLVREIFGNPFRPVTHDAAWRTDTAVALAQQMYDSRDFGAMPILADALQDAGCDNEYILDHSRNAKQVHVRGCWVADLVLGKE